MEEFIGIRCRVRKSTISSVPNRGTPWGVNIRSLYMRKDGWIGQIIRPCFGIADKGPPGGKKIMHAEVGVFANEDGALTVADRNSFPPVLPYPA